MWPKGSSARSSTDDLDPVPGHTAAGPSTEHIADLKFQILHSIGGDFCTAIREELKLDFTFIQTKLQAVRNQIANITAMTHSDIDQMKPLVKEVESGLSRWMDEMKLG